MLRKMKEYKGTSKFGCQKKNRLNKAQHLDQGIFLCDQKSRAKLKSMTSAQLESKAKDLAHAFKKLKIKNLNLIYLSKTNQNFVF